MDPLNAMTDTISRWNEGGSEETIASIKSLLQDAKANAAQLSSTVYSILKSACFDSISAESIESFLISIASDIVTNAAIDAVWMLEVDFESSENEQPRQRLLSIVKGLISKGILSSDLAKERLEVPFLQSIGLIQDSQVFQKKSVRINTALLYKQQKFNLLREESEGFSKLVTTVLEDMIQSSKHSSNVTDEEHLDSMMPQTMDKIRALIGYFDLDPNRVLDVILDIFTINVVEFYRFFLKLLKASPWNRNRSAAQQTYDAAIDLDGILEEEKTGHNVCAQIIGFKFVHYQQPATRDDVPQGLYLTTALLIKEGFIGFADIYPHLSPSDADMSKELTRFKDDMADLAMKAKSSALAMAAPLSDDTLVAPSSKTATAANAGPVAEQHPQKVMPIQKAGLLKAMLAIGDLQHSIFVLSRFYWISGPHPEVADLLCRLLHVSIEPIYAAQLRPNTKLPTDLSSQLPIPKSRSHPPLLPEQTVTLTAEATLPPSTLSTTYEYFYPSWKDQVPICASLDHALDTLTPLLKFIGLRIYRDVLLVTKLCRIGVAHVQSTQSNPTVMEAWMNMIRQYLLPALSQLHANPGMADELWRLLELYPYQTRYGLYGEWKESLYKMYPEMKVKKVDTEKESKGILRRISKDNVKQFGRMLAKLSHSNPTILFTIALDQIQAYDNLVGPVVDATRYLTAFGYDVLPYIVLESLSNPMKNRTKQDGTNASLWLASLASFTGTLLRKYNNMDPTTIVQYVANQLKAHNTKDLIVLNRLLTTMAGIDASLHLSDLQLSCFSGGEILKTELLLSMNPSEKRANLKRSSGRLLKSLLDSDLAVPLLILTAQQMQVCIYNVPEEESHLKALASLYDTAHVVFVQYVEFLVSNMTGEQYSDFIPSLKALMTNFGLEPNVTFHLARPKLANDVRKHDEVANEERLRAEARLKMEQNAKAAAEKNDAKDGMDEDVSTPSALGQSDMMAEPKDDAAPDHLEEVDMQTDLKTNDTHAADEATAISTFHLALSEVVQQIEDVLPEEVQQYLTPNFYLSFWRLGLGDISVPMKGYSTFIDTYHAKIRELDSSTDSTPGSTVKRKRDKERLQHAIAALNAELKKQLQIHEASMKRLKLDKDQWFKAGSASNPSRMEMVTLLLQHCIQPRAIFSPNDAIYSAKFIRLMHSIGAKHFSSLTLYDRILSEGLSPILFSLTENEAHNYARFLQEILRDFASLQSDEAVYNREGRGKNLPGFAKKWGVTPNDEPVALENLLTYEEFRHVLYKWHRKMYNAFKLCFDSKEYMHIRNAIIVLQTLPQLFPKVMWMGQNLTETVTELIAQETREDLKLLATGYLAILRKHKTTWIPVYQFHDDPGAQKAAEKAAAKRPPVPTKRVVPSKTAGDTLPPKPVIPRTGNNAAVNGSNAPSPRRNAPQSPLATAREPPKGPASSRDERDMPSSGLRASDRGPIPPRAGGRGPPLDVRVPRDRRDIGRDRERERERPRSPHGGSKRSREGSPDRALRNATTDSSQRGRDERMRDDRDRRPHGRDGRDAERDRRTGREREVRRDGPRAADAVDHKRRREDSSSSDKRAAEGTNGIVHDDKRRKTDENGNGATKATPVMTSTPAPVIAPAPVPTPASTRTAVPTPAEEPKTRSLSERMGKESRSGGHKIEESGIQIPSSSAPKRLKIAGSASASASPAPTTPTTPQRESPKPGVDNFNRRPSNRERDGRGGVRDGGNRDRSGPRGDRRGPGPRTSGNKNGRRH